MKKKKQPDMPWHPMKDGRRVKFDWVSFREAVNGMVRESHQSKSDIFRGIIQAIFPDYPEDAIDNNISTLYKWYGGKNGPRDLLEIYKPLSGFFGCEEDSFLVYEEIKEESKMNMTAAQATPVLPNGYAYPEGDNQIMKSMERMKEREIAHELYGILVDLIAAYLPADEKFWCGNGKKAEGEAKLVKYPKRIPVEIAIKKTSPYLPKELRYKLEVLLEDMYGPYEGIWTEVSGNSSDFLDMKEKQFEEYVKRHGHNPQDLNFFVKTALQVTMVNDEEYDLFERLDDIFSDYLCD